VGSNKGSPARGEKIVPHELPPLPYFHAALESHVDEETRRLHPTDVDDLNTAIEGTRLDGRPPGEAPDNLDLLPENRRAAVHDDGGGHANHPLVPVIRQLACAGGGRSAAA
jgi:Fe-Mn family superoxide dismutase